MKITVAAPLLRYDEWRHYSTLFYAIFHYACAAAARLCCYARHDMLLLFHTAAFTPVSPLMLPAYAPMLFTPC